MVALTIKYDKEKQTLFTLLDGAKIIATGIKTYEDIAEEISHQIKHDILLPGVKHDE